MVLEKDSAARRRAVSDFLEKIRNRRPIVQCITNIVTVNDCANALLAIGASPTMAHHPQEMADFARLCDALVCNLGATESLEAMEKAAVLAAERSHPVVLDPVGCAGSPFRRDEAWKLLGGGAGAGDGFGIEEKSRSAQARGRKGRISCIRGNAAEIRALAQHRNTGKGVDDLAAEEAAGRPLPAAGSRTEAFETPHFVTALARQTGAIVIASGVTDYVGDGETILEVKGGSPMMAKITGSGCMLSALLGAFLAAECSPESAAACCAMMADCGEQAALWTREKGGGTGTFHIALLDALSLYLN